MGVVERPGQPGRVRFWLRERARRTSDCKKPTKPQIGLLAGKMAEALVCNDDKARHLCLEYIWSEDVQPPEGEEFSSTLLSRGQVDAMLRWLIACKDEDTGDYVLDRSAVKELALIWGEAQREAGQQEIRFEDLRSATDKSKSADELVAELFG